MGGEPTHRSVCPASRALGPLVLLRAAQQEFIGQILREPRRPLPSTDPCFSTDGHRKVALF